MKTSIANTLIRVGSVLSLVALVSPVLSAEDPLLADMKRTRERAYLQNQWDALDRSSALRASHQQSVRQEVRQHQPSTPRPIFTRTR